MARTPPAPAARRRDPALVTDFSAANGNVIDNLGSLKQLRRLQPDIWQLAFRADGQNANRYNSAWEDIIVSNRQLLE